MSRPLSGILASVIAVSTLLFVPIGHAQSSQTRVEFDIASIKSNLGNASSAMRQFRGGRYTTRYATLKELIRHAYGVDGRSMSDRQVVGAPTWLGVDRFDIEATAPGVREDSRGMIPWAVELRIRSLLEDRCALVTHMEQRELPLYSLKLADRDGRLGPRLRRRSTPCVPAALAGATPSKRVICGGRAQPGMLLGTGATIENITYGIAQFVPDVDRVVVDRTGLTGTFDFDLAWTPDLPIGAPTTDSVTAPGLLTALQEQLGLKLEPSKGLVDVLVIDHVERPREN